MDAVGASKAAKAAKADDAQVGPVDITGPEMDQMMAWLKAPGLRISELTMSRATSCSIRSRPGRRRSPAWWAWAKTS